MQVHLAAAKAGPSCTSPRARVQLHAHLARASARCKSSGSTCRFTSQLPKLGILGRTIGRVVPHIAVFFLISCVIFLAFAQCFFVAYYATVPGYQTYWESLMSVLRFTVLDFDYDALSKVCYAVLLRPLLGMLGGPHVGAAFHRPRL